MASNFQELLLDIDGAEVDGFRAAMQILVNVLADDDDEKCILKENDIFTKFITDHNKSRINQVSLLSSLIPKQEAHCNSSVNDPYTELKIKESTEINEEPEIKKKKQLRIYDDSFYENTIPRFTIDEFKVHFGMTRSTAAKLMDRLVPFTESYPHSKKVPMRKRTLLCLWILCNEETYRSVGKRFGMAHGNCHYLFVSVCSAICKIAEDLVVWPSPRDQLKIAEEISSKYGMPNTVGAIGSCQLTIKTPEVNAQTFYNHEGTPCIVLQGVCDHKLAFTDIYAGQAGSVDYGSVFKSSPVCENLKTIIIPDHHLVGDSCFPIFPSLITPYEEETNLLEPQKTFNSTIKPVESLIHKAFALLKNKFKRLKFLDMQRIDLIMKVVLAACVLHNHVIVCEEDDFETDIISQVDDGSTEAKSESVISTYAIDSGNEKRNALVSLLAENNF